jgi:hypothetical protein
MLLQLLLDATGIVSRNTKKHCHSVDEGEGALQTSEPSTAKFCKSILELHRICMEFHGYVVELFHKLVLGYILAFIGLRKQ